MRRSRSLTETDRATWASYAQMVAPLPGVAMPEPPPVLPYTAAPPPEPPTPARRLLARPPAALAVGTAPAGLDAASWNRFRTGKMAPSRTLDLHGRTAQVAYVALERFLHAAVAEGLRCVEVITGRGKGEGGVIRREFPLWLNQAHLRTLVLAAAHPHALNPGSVRLLLRRARKP